MAEQPPLSRFYVIGYSANDRSFPILAQVLDPRVAGYRVPEDLSACPDKRYPNHVFTGAQPLSGDERVRHTWEILPSPYVPFTRYDDDLGPVQGRRRFVVNSGQEASLERDKKVSYEAREGSAIVSSEIEETWDAGSTDPDLESPFPIKDRDFYDPSRGPVQERRQLVSTTGNEIATLENKDGVITQTSYEAYNEFLSFKVVQTYSVDGPQLVGKATDNDGQLITVTTQRKGADNYTPPSPTATRTVEVNREDAESLVERIVDTPEVFKANTFSVERPDPIPQKFRVAVPIQSSQEIVEGDADPNVSLDEGELSKSEEQRNKFIKRVSSTSRDQAVLPQTLTGKSTNNERQEVVVTETLQLGNTDETPTATTTVESEALGDGNYVITKTEVDEVFSAITLSKERPDPVPAKFRTAIPSLTRQENLEGEAEEPALVAGEIVKSEQQVNKFVKRISTTARDANQLPKSLTQKLTTNEGLLATVTETLQTGDTTAIPTSKRTVESEALGDGTYVVRVTESPEVFSAKTFRAEKADLTPQKFRAKQSDLTTEENVEGTAAQPTLGEDQFLKSEQQINEFVKRVVTNNRTTELNTNLNEFVITPEGQLATRTTTLSKSPQTITPSATVVDANVEELGDGRTVKTEIKVDKVFDGKQESLEKPEVIPPEFRASLQNKTISEVKVGESSSITSLSKGELSKTIQRLTEHKIRETKVTRPSSNYDPLTGQLVDNDQIKVTRTRTVAQTNQTITPSAKVSGTVEALGDGYTLKTEDTKDLVFDAKQETLSQSVQIPPKFFNNKATETSVIEEGTEAVPQAIGTDGFGVVRSSAQRVNAFTLRKTKTEQSGITSLTEKQLNNSGQEVTVQSSITGSPTITTGPTIEFSRSQSIGGGKFVTETGRVNKVFAGKTLSIEKPETIPAKFRVEIPNKTEETTEEGNVSDAIDLGPDELSKSEQEIRDGVIRTRTTTRSAVPLASLVQRTTTNEKQLATITESLQDGDTSTAPSATVNIQSEAIGDGKYIVTETSVPRLFGNVINTVERVDVVPTKFKADLPTTVEERNLAKVIEYAPQLGQNEIFKSEQQINEFVTRELTRSRKNETLERTAEGQVYVSELNGGLANVIEHLGSNPTITPSKNTVSAEKEYLGDGLYLTREVLLDEIITLSGQNYDDTFDISIPFTREIIDAGELAIDESAHIEPRNSLHSIKTVIDKNAFTEVLKGYHVQSGDVQNISLPDVLKSVSVKIYNEESGSNDIAEGSGNSASASASIGIDCSSVIDTNIRNGYSGPAKSVRHIFFLPEDDSGYDAILAKTGALTWPVMRPKQEKIEVTTVSEQRSARVALSLPNNVSRSKGGGKRTSRSVVNIPPTLHEQITVNSSDPQGSPTASTSVSVSGPSGASASENLIVNSSFKIIPPSLAATDPSSFPSGLYLYSVNASPYRYGFLRVEAIVVEVTADMTS